MSSILDALRKLEQEKAAREAPETPSVRELARDPELAFSERGESSRLRSPGLYFGIGLILAGLTAGGVALAMLVKPRAAETPAAVATVKVPAGSKIEIAGPPPPVATVVTPVTVPSVAPASQSVPNRVTAPPANAVRVAKAPEKPAPIEQKTETPKPAPAKTAETERPAPVIPAAQTESHAAEVTAPPAAEPDSTQAASDKIEMDKLPVFSESERVRLGLPPLKINIVGMPSNRNPRASALINMQKVYVGEYIPDTNARLLAVDLRGVAIEVNGRRYFLSRR